MNTRSTTISLMAGILFLCTVVPAHAITLGFQNITNNLAGDAAIGEAQLFVDVTDYGSDQALFTFRNTGPDACSITDVYFDDWKLLSGIAGFIDSDDDALGAFGDSGVDFSDGASPSNLPGGAAITPSFVADFSADSDPPAQPNGVNPGESLGILFDLQDDKLFADVKNELTSGDLRIGIHVQGFASGGSESFTAVPEPASMLLLGTGLIGLAVVARKRRKK